MHSTWTGQKFCCLFNPFPHMPILASSNSMADRGMMSKIWTNEDTIV